MFTGIVEAKGELLSRTGHRLVVRSSKVFEGLERGESVAVNGCCLTLESWSGNDLVFHVLSETLDRTNLGKLNINDTVNLERALRLGGRLGGHLVTGHIDGTGKVLELNRGRDTVLAVAFPENLACGMVQKGSIAIDGVSLTIAGLEENVLKVCLIPVTLHDTALAERKAGDAVNLETDLAGKYFLRRMELAENTSAQITMKTLEEAGFL